MIDSHTKFRDKGEQNIVVPVKNVLHRDLWPMQSLTMGWVIFCSALLLGERWCSILSKDCHYRLIGCGIIGAVALFE